MICINCQQNDTQIINSRPAKHSSQVWRRRHCKTCKATFTTYERACLSDNKLVSDEHSKNTEKFNLGKLILSIANSFSHDPTKAKSEVYHLALTIEDHLFFKKDILTTNSIKETTYETLKRFDPIAGLQYAVQHNLITSTKKNRGRPSFSEQVTPKHE